MSLLSKQIKELRQKLDELEEKELEVSETLRFPTNDDTFRGLEVEFTVHPHGWDDMEGPVLCTSPNGHYLWLMDKSAWLKLRADFDRVMGTA